MIGIIFYICENKNILWEIMLIEKIKSNLIKGSKTIDLKPTLFKPH